MPRYVLLRFLRALGTFALVVVLLFLVSRVLPADPAQQLAGPYASEEQVARVNEQFDLEEAIPLQFARFVGDVVTFDFGPSLADPGENAAELAWTALGESVRLLSVALALTLPLGAVAGLVASRRDDRLVDRGIVVAAVVGVATPPFAVAVLAQYGFGMRLGWFPPTADAPGGSGVLTVIDHLLLPAMTIALVFAGVLALTVRNARRGGSARTSAVRGTTVVALAAMARHAGPLLGALAALEVVFALPGLGGLAYEAVTTHDFAVFEPVVLIAASIVIACSFSADLILRRPAPQATARGVA